jgi:hypothetical protein
MATLSGKEQPLMSKKPTAIKVEIIKPEKDRYCDHCKAMWGKVKDKHTKENVWHDKARISASVLVVSYYATGKIERAYCSECRDHNSRWADGSIWPLAEQVSYFKVATNG